MPDAVALTSVTVWLMAKRLSLVAVLEPETPVVVLTAFAERAAPAALFCPSCAIAAASTMFHPVTLDAASAEPPTAYPSAPRPPDPPTALTMLEMTLVSSKKPK